MMVSASIRAIQRSDTSFWERSVDFDDDIIYGRCATEAPRQLTSKPSQVKRKPVPAQKTSLSPYPDFTGPSHHPQSQYGMTTVSNVTGTNSRALNVPVNDSKRLSSASLEDLILSTLAYEGQFADHGADPVFELGGTPVNRPEPPTYRTNSSSRNNPISRPKLAPLRTDLNRHSRPPTLVETFDNVAPQLIHPDEDEDSSSESEISLRTPSKDSIDLQDPLTAKIDSAIEELSHFQPLSRIEKVQELPVKEENASPHPSVASSIAMLRFMMQAEYSP